MGVINASPRQSYGCPYAALIRSIWQADHAEWAVRTASEESGCSVTARNPRTCDSYHPHPYLHAVGLLQECGYSGPLDATAELNAAWSLCLAQPTAWSFHGRCR